MEQVACDLCGSERFQELHPSTIPQDDEQPALYFASSRQRVGHGRIVRCEECGLVMTNPRDDAATLALVYRALEDRVYDAEEHTRRITACEHLALVHAYHPAPGQLLDVGCSTGIFAQVAHEAGWQVTGLEPSGWAVGVARERCPDAMFLHASLEGADLPAGHFDAVTLWDVLEHVNSPTDTLERVRRWLKPGGWLFMNLPNADSLVARMMGARWVLLLREHLWYFSPHTIRSLLEKCGLHLEQTAPSRVTYTLRNVFVRLSQYENTALGTLGQRLAGLDLAQRIRIRFPIGDMHVVARTQTRSG